MYVRTCMYMYVQYMYLHVEGMLYACMHMSRHTYKMFLNYTFS